MPSTPATARERASHATFPRVIDATMRSTWLACRHSFFRRHCQGLTHDVPSVHLHFGACLASGLEEARKQYCRGVRASEAVLAGAEYLVREWGGAEFEAHTRTEANKTLENCLLALTDYFREWPLDADPVQIHYHKSEPCIEFSFAREIPGTRHPDTNEEILYAGRFDMIGNFRGKPWGVDDKTTSSMSDKWDQQWSLRGQFTGYCWGAAKYGVDLDGFLVRGIQILTDSTRCRMAITARPRWMIDRWLAQLQADVADMLKCWEHWQQYSLLDIDLDEPGQPSHPYGQVLDSGCFSYQRPCEFMPLCTSPTPDQWESEYTVKHWNPLTRGLE